MTATNNSEELEKEVEVLEEDFDSFFIDTPGVGGNKLLKPPGIQISFEPWQIEEFTRCQNDAVYFCEKYVKIVNLDEGIINFKMYDFQKRFVKAVKDNRFTIVRCGRQMGKTTTAAGILLHEGLFSPNSTIAILANKMDTAQEILERIQMAYENLPLWLQQGVFSWNKRSMHLENGSKYLAAPTSSSAIRGKSISTLYLDEFAHIEAKLQQRFFTSTYPVISSGKSTKIIITSTPNGMELYYKLWTDAINKRNSYFAVDVHWSEVPGRDEAWKAETIANTSKEQFRQEYEVEFLGSSDTLLSADCLQRLSYDEPIKTGENVKIYQEPMAGGRYVILVDTARGVGHDYSAFVIVNISGYPHTISAVYRSQDIEPILYPYWIDQFSKMYNDAYILVETNDIGMQVGNMLINEYENENLLRVTATGRKGQVLSGGYGTAGKSNVGLKTTAASKRIGCLNLKSLVESNRLIVNDYDMISEFSTFVANGNSYEAEYGKNDDVVMCLVLYGWLSQQMYFKELTSSDIRKNLMDERLSAAEEEIAGFGFSTIHDDLNKSEGSMVFHRDEEVWDSSFVIGKF